MDVFGNDSEVSKSNDFHVKRYDESTFLCYYPGQDGSIDAEIDLRGTLYLRDGADHEEYFEEFLEEVEKQESGIDGESIQEAAEALEHSGVYHE